ncbi:hypothetical protein ACFO6U_10550, partial [Enterococcus canintestini]|uniref:hypothetical protein n=1 Tax=Enterococcus canintestini TaxID=317010 RepID=UPI0036244CD4
KVAKAIWLEHEMRKPASLGAGRCKGLIALVQTTLLKGGYDFYQVVPLLNYLPIFFTLLCSDK